MTKIEVRKKAFLALRILKNNKRQSVALSVFHDELCAFDEEIAEYRKLCVMAFEEGGFSIDSIPKFSDWFQTMDDGAKEVFTEILAGSCHKHLRGAFFHELHHRTYRPYSRPLQQPGKPRQNICGGRMPQ